VHHAVDASEGCAPALVGVRVELLFCENVTASLSKRLAFASVSEILKGAYLAREGDHVQLTRGLTRLCCVVARVAAAATAVVALS
jgi:pyrroline-5-carboxylate reductase